MDVVWDGITRSETLNESAANARSALAEAAKGYNWSRVFELVSEHNELVNSCRPGGKSLYAPLHQAAHGGAPVDVMKQLIEMERGGRFKMLAVNARSMWPNERGIVPYSKFWSPCQAPRSHRGAPEDSIPLPRGYPGQSGSIGARARFATARTGAASGTGSAPDVVRGPRYVRRVQLPLGLGWRRGKAGLRELVPCRRWVRAAARDHR